jgi:hypothetical protein
MAHFLSRRLIQMRWSAGNEWMHVPCQRGTYEVARNLAAFRRGSLSISRWRNH